MKNEQFSKSAINFDRKIIPSELFIELKFAKGWKKAY